MPRSAAGRAHFHFPRTAGAPTRRSALSRDQTNKRPGTRPHRAFRFQGRSAIAPVSRVASGRLLVLLVVVDLRELRIDDVFLGFALGALGARARTAVGSSGLRL